jgi:hypothetical protein
VTPGTFTEATPYDPRSPYSASKAGSDHLVQAYHHTYGLPVTMTNCSNNYGPFQFPEKLVPVMILNMLEGKALPVYGDGRNIRDWLYVEDHNAAVWTVMQKGRLGQTYNIGGENEWENIKLLDRLIEIVASEAGKKVADLRALITYVKDRPGHDRRYAIDRRPPPGALDHAVAPGADHHLAGEVAGRRPRVAGPAHEFPHAGRPRAGTSSRVLWRPPALGIQSRPVLPAGPRPWARRLPFLGPATRGQADGMLPAGCRCTGWRASPRRDDAQQRRSWHSGVTHCFCKGYSARTTWHTV